MDKLDIINFYKMDNTDAAWYSGYTAEISVFDKFDFMLLYH